MIEIPKPFVCRRCQHVWYPRSAKPKTGIILPQRCPLCHSKYYADIVRPRTQGRQPRDIRLARERELKTVLQPPTSTPPPKEERRPIFIISGDKPSTEPLFNFTHVVDTNAQAHTRAIETEQKNTPTEPQQEVSNNAARV